MTAIRSLAFLALAATAVVGCTEGPPHIARSSYDTAPSAIAFDLAFRPGSDKLANGERQRVAEALRALQPRSGDDVSVRMATTGDGDLDKARAATAAAALAGTQAHVRIVGTDAKPLGAGAGDIAVVEVTRFGRVRVVCPTPIEGWETDRLLVSPPVACTNAVNIAEMAVSPERLVNPRPLGPTPGSTAADAVIRYDTDKVKEPSDLNDW